MMPQKLDHMDININGETTTDLNLVRHQQMPQIYL
jgi:hypothetical protein